MTPPVESSGGKEGRVILRVSTEPKGLCGLTQRELTFVAAPPAPYSRQCTVSDPGVTPEGDDHRRSTATGVVVKNAKRHVCGPVVVGKRACEELLP